MTGKNIILSSSKVFFVQWKLKCILTCNKCVENIYFSSEWTRFENITIIRILHSWLTYLDLKSIKIDAVNSFYHRKLSNVLVIEWHHWQLYFSQQLNNLEIKIFQFSKWKHYNGTALNSFRVRLDHFNFSSEISTSQSGWRVKLSKSFCTLWLVPFAFLPPLNIFKKQFKIHGTFWNLRAKKMASAAKNMEDILSERKIRSSCKSNGRACSRSWIEY